MYKAKKIVVQGSASGIYLTAEVFPRLGLSNQVTERGSQATAVLAAKEANIAIQPSSELVNIAGIDYVGALPEQIQLIQTFAGAIVINSQSALTFDPLITPPHLFNSDLT